MLNFSPWFALGVDGWSEGDGDALLQEVTHYCLDGRGAYYHRWSMSDMVLWDNWRMLHCATGVPAGERRHMQRTTISGDYGKGRLVNGEATPAPAQTRFELRRLRNRISTASRCADGGRCA